MLTITEQQIKTITKEIVKLSKENTSIKHSTVLEIISKSLGYRDYNSLAAIIKKENPTKTDEYLLEKYRIPEMGDYSKPGSELCNILHRLDTNKKLDEVDKKWIKDKGMFKFYKFLENWERTGKA